MLLGTSSPLAHNTPQDWAKRHYDLGLRAVNFPLNCDDDPDRIDAYVKAAQNRGLTIAEVGVWRNMMSPDQRERKANIAYCIRELELADHIGAKCCVNILGARGPKWDGAYRDNFSREAWRLGVKTIQEIIDTVRPKNTYFTIESMPWMYPMGPDEYLQLLEEVDRDRFAVHLDLFNWMTTPDRYFFSEEFIDECFDTLGEYVKSCHLKDVRLEEEYTIHFTETAVGNGGVNIGHLISRAESYQKDMPFIIEHLDTDAAYLSSVTYIQQLVSKKQGGKKL